MRSTNQRGFALLELVLLLGIVGALISLTLIHVENSRLQARENQLKNSLQEFRAAIYRYYQDHGHFPCSPEDFNRRADANVLRQQLLWFTNRRGKPSRTRNREFRFGPYLRDFPAEPISGLADVFIDTTGGMSLVELKKAVSTSRSGRGGWYYQANTGFWLANLSRIYFKEQYAYY